MKKLLLSTVLAAFCASSFSAVYACDGMKGHEKSEASTQSKKQDKKAEGAPKSDQKPDQKS
jgi:hypothetical protein